MNAGLDIALLSFQLQFGNSVQTVSASMSSLANSVSTRVIALYKGLTVAVYQSNKQDISLTQRDLIDIANVSCCIAVFNMIQNHQIGQLVIAINYSIRNS